MPGAPLGAPAVVLEGVVVVRSGVVMLAGGAVLAALLPAAAGAAPQGVEVAPAAASESIDDSPVTGVIVRGVLSADEAADAVDSALPDGTAVEEARGGPGGTTLVQLDGAVEAQVAQEVADRLTARRDVRWAAPNYRVEAFALPPVSTNDPRFADQYNLWDSRASSPGGYSVKAPSFWSTTRGSADTVVAVVDTGVDLAHPDLRGQLVPGYDLVDDEYTCSSSGECRNLGTFSSAGDGDGLDPDPSDPGDWMDASYVRKCGAGWTKDDYAPSSWHGTHVAGIVAAKADDGVGVVGVAPGVRVQPVRVLGHCGGTTWDTLMGVLWASGADLVSEAEDPYYAGVGVNPTPADVINLSLGSTVTSSTARSSMCEAYGWAVGVARARGATVVAAAGNDSFTTNVSANFSVPASCPGVVSVGAISRTGHRSYYSQAGSSVDISAPGGDEALDGRSILSTVNAGRTVPTTSTYAEYEGTSMATPHVAAAAALLYSQGATDPKKVEATLRASVAPFPARSAAFASMRVTAGGRTYRLADLNCNSKTCGSGVLDLSRFRTRTTGTASVGRSLTAQGWRTSLEGTTYTWGLEGVDGVIGTGRSLQVPLSSLGKRVTLTATSGATSDTVVTGVVARSITSTAVSIPSKVKRTSRPVLRVAVSAPVVPTGTLQVFDGRKRLATQRLSTAAKGRVSIRLPKLAKGKHRIRVVYSGDRSLKGSTSSTRTVTSR